VVTFVWEWLGKRLTSNLLAENPTSAASDFPAQPKSESKTFPLEQFVPVHLFICLVIGLQLCASPLGFLFSFLMPQLLLLLFLAAVAAAAAATVP